MKATFGNDRSSSLGLTTKARVTSAPAMMLGSWLLSAAQGGCGATADVADVAAMEGYSQDPMLGASSKSAENPDTELRVYRRCKYQSDGNFYCLHSIDDRGSWVRVWNKSTIYTVSLREEEWHSHCGAPNWGAGWSEQDVPPGGSIDIPFRHATGLCREKYIIKCKLGGIDVRKCTDVLDAIIIADL